MSRLTLNDQERLLRMLAQIGSYGRAEGESTETFRKTFLPVPEHVRAFEPDVVLVVGERGAGKSELFRAVLQERLLRAIERHAPTTRFPPSRMPIRWEAGYPLGSDFPSGRVLRRFAQTHDKEAMADLWLAYLVRTLRTHLDESDRRTLAPLLQHDGAAADANFDAFRSLGDEPELSLTRLDRRLAQEGSWLFVGYDELDALGRSDWHAMVSAIQGLVSFWAEYARRWGRLRAKIFLRTDLFQRNTTLRGAELSKLAANRVELIWSDRNLYAMLAKRIANFDEEFLEYCRRAHVPFADKIDPVLGVIPRLQKAEDAKQLVDRMIGEYMGEGPKKGTSFYWLLDHMRDGRGRALPRPLVRLLEKAAEIEVGQRRATIPRLLSPPSLRRALDDVSRDHVKQMIEHECPWLEGVERRLSKLEVPCKRREMERRLSRNWSEPFSTGAGDEVRPPTDDAAALVDYLVELGIVRFRSSGLADVPDLFIAGLGLVRRGGVARN